MLTTATDIGIVAVHTYKREEFAFEIAIGMTPEDQWTVQRRYDDFKALHTALSGQFTSVRQDISLPQRHQLQILLSKELRHQQNAHRLLGELNGYLQRLLETPSVHESASFQSFFAIEKAPVSPSKYSRYSISSNNSSEYTDCSSDYSIIESSQAQTIYPAAIPQSLSCSSPVLYGQPMQWSACAGFSVALVKSHNWSMRRVGLTKGVPTSFIAESTTAFTRPSRAIHFGDICRLRIDAANYFAIGNKGRLAVSNRRRSTLVRFVSPSHEEGPILCTSDVWIQQVSDQLHQTRWIGVHKDKLVASIAISPVAIHVRVHECHTPDVPHISMPAPLNVRALTYNVWFLPQVATSILHLSPHKAQRARAIPSVIPSETDVVVFTEAFDDTAKLTLTTEMKRRGFIYETRTAGSKTNLKLFNSGVFAMSKYPLDHYDEILYGSVAIADERLADKGSIYVQMKKDGQTVHVFGTHTQAWDHDAAIACRAKQIEMLSSWIKSKKIPADEAVIFAGDFNIDMHVKNEYDEFGKLLAALGATNPEMVEGAPKHSFDPFANPLASGGKSSGGKLELLDYVMYGSHHRVPRQSWTKVMPVTASVGWHDKKGNQIVDLSDHYPVMSEFQFV